jgi:hypothetical protein
MPNLAMGGFSLAGATACVAQGCLERANPTNRSDRGCAGSDRSRWASCPNAFSGQSTVAYVH